MPLRQQSISGTALDAYLRKKGSPLAGMGGTFVSAGSQYGVDPRLLVSIAGAETSLGAYRPSQKIHNPFGMGPGIQYPNYAAAIGAAAQNLSKNYLGQGLDTIQEIQQKWAPSGASNDPTGLNNNWVRNVSQYYSEMGGDPAAQLETQNYVQTAAALEAQYAQAGDQPEAPTLTAIQPPQPQGPALDFISPQQQTPLSAGVGASLGELTQHLKDNPLPMTDRDSGSNAIVRAKIQEKLRQTIGDTAAKQGLTVEWDHNDPVSPNTPAIVAAAADYNATLGGGLVEESRKWLGTPYSWGGGGPKGPTFGIGRGAGTKGFDCSGFVQYLYSKQGISIPRTTYDQVKVGTAVRFKDLEPGDIMFFRPGKLGPEHEGLYIGNGQFIQAPRTGDVVKISSINDAYYKKNFVTARRVRGGTR